MSPNRPLPLGSHRSVTAQKMSTGRWRARTRVRDLDGVTRSVEAHGKSSGEAKDRLLSALANRITPEIEIRGDMKVSELAPLWLARVEAGGLIRRSSLKLYRSTTEKIVLGPGGIGAWRVAEARPQTLAAFFARASAKTPGRAATVRTVLMQMFQFAVLNGALNSNPVTEIPPAVKTVPEARALTEDELDWLREAFTIPPRLPGAMGPAPDSLLADALVALAASGCRIGELLALQVRGWNRQTFQIDITGTIPSEGELSRQPTKTHAGMRQLTIPTWAVGVFNRRVAMTDGGPESLLFGARGGGAVPMSPANFRRKWRLALTRSPHAPELFGITPKDLRKTVATQIGAKDRAAAAHQLGHEGEGTLPYYVERRIPSFNNTAFLDALNPDARMEKTRVAALQALAAELDVDVSDGGLDTSGTRLLVLGWRADERTTDPSLFETSIAPLWAGQKVRVLAGDSAESRALGTGLPMLYSTFG